MDKVRFIKYLRQEKRASEHTIHSYESDLTQFGAFLEQEFELKPNDCKSPHVRSWVMSLSESGLAPKSIHRKLSTLRAYFKYLLSQGAIDLNPMDKVSAPKLNKPLPAFIEEKNIDELFNFEYFEDDWKGKRDRLILELFYMTGMRRAELISLQWQSLNKSAEQVKVLGKRKKERIIPISGQLIKDLEQLRTDMPEEYRDSYLFLTDKGKKLYPEFVYRLVKKHIQRVSSISKKSPHVLRHSFATHLLNNGADLMAVKELLGHSNLSATEIYTHNTFEKLKNIYKSAHPRA